MPWTERQRAMLEEMGLRLWQPTESATDNTEPTPAVRSQTASPAAVAPVAAPIRPPALQDTVPASVRSIPLTAEMPSTAATDIARMDWTALRAAVARCTACKLCERRTNTVFGVGSERARWMVVGEAPGEQEDLRGEPFVGKAGRLLDNMLAALGLTRGDGEPERQVFIANTLKCRPPGNRNPEPEELARCEPFLIRQVALVQPKVILAMGRFAVQSLLRSTEPIGRLRGRVHSYHGVPLIVTYHPAYLLRNLEDKAKAWDDLCLAREAAETVAMRP